MQWDEQRPSRIVLVRRRTDGEREFQGFAGDRGLGFADQALAPVLVTLTVAVCSDALEAVRPNRCWALAMAACSSTLLEFTATIRGVLSSYRKEV